jgi:hypothetical protein
MQTSVAAGDATSDADGMDVRLESIETATNWGTGADALSSGE